jgi:hypothetical protein
MIRKNFIYSVLVILTMTCSIVLAQVPQKPATGTTKPQPIALSTFKHGDIGSPSIAGVVKVVSNGIDLIASGADVWGVKDEFSFVYVQRTGDFDIFTRIESFMPANLYSKAGLMAREDLTADCRHIYFQVFSDNNARNNNNGGYEFQYRQLKGGEMKAIYPATANGQPEFPVAYPNVWVRLKRVNNDFTGFYSIDGKTWKPYTTYTLELPQNIYLGLAVTSHNTSHAATVKFRNISELKTK